MSISIFLQVVFKFYILLILFLSFFFEIKSRHHVLGIDWDDGQEVTDVQGLEDPIHGRRSKDITNLKEKQKSLKRKAFL